MSLSTFFSESRRSPDAVDHQQRAVALIHCPAIQRQWGVDIHKKLNPSDTGAYEYFLPSYALALHGQRDVFRKSLQKVRFIIQVCCHWVAWVVFARHLHPQSFFVKRTLVIPWEWRIIGMLLRAALITGPICRDASPDVDVDRAATISPDDGGTGWPDNHFRGSGPEVSGDPRDRKRLKESDYFVTYFLKQCLWLLTNWKSF